MVNMQMSERDAEFVRGIMGDMMNAISGKPIGVRVIAARIHYIAETAIIAEMDAAIARADAIAAAEMHNHIGGR